MCDFTVCITIALLLFCYQLSCFFCSFEFVTITPQFSFNIPFHLNCQINTIWKWFFHFEVLWTWNIGNFVWVYMQIQRNDYKLLIFDEIEKKRNQMNWRNGKKLLTFFAAFLPMLNDPNAVFYRKPENCRSDRPQLAAHSYWEWPHISAMSSKRSHSLFLFMYVKCPGETV